MNRKVTVIIPSYNSPYIKDTIQSLKEQTYPIDEIIIVDDEGDLSDIEGVQLIKNGTRMGKSKSINKAVSISKNQVILCVDSDTMLGRTCLERMIVHLVGDIVVVTARVYAEETGHWIAKIRKKRYDNWFSGGYQIINGCCFLSTKEFLEENPLPSNTLTEDEKLSEDINKSKDSIWVLAKTAKVYTREPESFRDLVKQLTRWNYGMIQNTTKGKVSVFFGILIISFVFYSIFSTKYILSFLALLAILAFGCISTQTYTLGGIKYFIAELSSLYLAGLRYFFERPPKW